MKINLDMKVALANSFKNFHAKGLDYICLERTPKLTRKLYILEGDVSKVPEVVNPHNHRYRFSTLVLVGKMIEHRWVRTSREDRAATPYNAFDYMTPLNGGNGFTYRGMERLRRLTRESLPRAHTVETQVRDIHTIQMAADQTVLMLHQYEDELPLDQPTSTWAQDEPSISDPGLYERFTEGELMDRLRRIAGPVISAPHMSEG